MKLTPPRSPWQLIYGGAHHLRRRWWTSRAGTLPRPVISVGNLHWGGTGKTPLTAAIAGWLRDQGQQVCILSRGYGGSGKGVRVVSRGEGPLLGPKVAGDEPVLLAGALPGVSVVVGPDRHRAGLQALQRLDPAPDLFLLDDGFSHLRLARALDLLVLPASDLFGGGRLPPGGRLREPLASAKHAHALLITGSARREMAQSAAQALRAFGFAGPAFAAPTRIGEARLASGEPLPPTTPLVAAAGIARPERFFDAAVAQGLDLRDRMTFPDHHAYLEASLEKLRNALDQTAAGALLITEKDLVKLRGRSDLPLAYLPVRAEPEEGFWEWLGVAGGLIEELPSGDVTR
ncbi:MAG: tetraacyldisaccharide 4'-kinase [Acidobacteriota bacterium]